MYYVNLGLADDALRLLEVAPEQATIRYWQAYLLREKSPERSREMLKKAAALSPYLVFPYREESIPVFQWADKALPGDWKAKYYLGLIYWGLRRQEEALETAERSAETSRTTRPPTCAAPGSRKTPIPRRRWRTSRERMPSIRRTGGTGSTWPLTTANRACTTRR